MVLATTGRSVTTMDSEAIRVEVVNGHALHRDGTGQILEAGAAGYLRKTGPGRELVEAVRARATGG